MRVCTCVFQCISGTLDVRVCTCVFQCISGTLDVRVCTCVFQCISGTVTYIGTHLFLQPAVVPTSDVMVTTSDIIIAFFRRPESLDAAVERFTLSCAGYCVATYVLVSTCAYS